MSKVLLTTMFAKLQHESCPPLTARLHRFSPTQDEGWRYFMMSCSPISTMSCQPMRTIDDDND